MDRHVEIELYEDVRVRAIRRRIISISLGAIAFLSLCSIPVLKERGPKWSSLHAAQVLSVEIEKLKAATIHEKKPIRLKFLDNGRYIAELVEKCEDLTAVRTYEEGNWSASDSNLTVLNQARAKDFSLKLADDQICFDPVAGLFGVRSKRVLVIVPVNDLTDNRLDRASYVVLEGESAKISIN